MREVYIAKRKGLRAHAFVIVEDPSSQTQSLKEDGIYDCIKDLLVAQDLETLAAIVHTYGPLSRLPLCESECSEDDNHGHPRHMGIGAFLKRADELFEAPNETVLFDELSGFRGDLAETNRAALRRAINRRGLSTKAVDELREQVNPARGYTATDEGADSKSSLQVCIEPIADWILTKSLLAQLVYAQTFEQDWDGVKQQTADPENPDDREPIYSSTGAIRNLRVLNAPLCADPILHLYAGDAADATVAKEDIELFCPLLSAISNYPDVAIEAASQHEEAPKKEPSPSFSGADYDYETDYGYKIMISVYVHLPVLRTGTSLFGDELPLSNRESDQIREHLLFMSTDFTVDATLYNERSVIGPELLDEFEWIARSQSEYVAELLVNLVGDLHTPPRRQRTGELLGWQTSFKEIARTNKPTLEFSSLFSELVYRSVCHSEDIKASVCRYCGKPMLYRTTTRPRLFCTDTCRANRAKKLTDTGTPYTLDDIIGCENSLIDISTIVTVDKYYLSDMAEAFDDQVYKGPTNW